MDDGEYECVIGIKPLKKGVKPDEGYKEIHAPAGRAQICSEGSEGFRGRVLEDLARGLWVFDPQKEHILKVNYIKKEAE